MRVSGNAEDLKWIFFIILSISLFIGFTYLYRPKPISSIVITTSSCSCSSPVSRTCPENSTEVRFLHSRPFCMYLLDNDIVSKAISLSKVWEPSTTRFISLLLADSPKKPAVFLDIGANIGWFTVVMSVLGNRVIAIEPMLNNVKLMQASLQASFASQNVIIYPHGLGDSSDKCILFSGDINIGDGHVICGKEANKGMHAQVPQNYSVRQVIKVSPLDVLVSEDIDVMKIDVEGSELFAVRSGTQLFDQFHVHHVLSEFSPFMLRGKNVDPYEYLQFFVSRGYELRVMNENMADLYSNKTWQTIPIHRSKEALQNLTSNTTFLDIWFTKPLAKTRKQYNPN